MFNTFGCSNSLIIYWDYLVVSLSLFAMYKFKAASFFLSLVFTSPHKFYRATFSLWFSKKHFLTPFETASLTHRFSLSVLLNSQYLAAPGYIFKLISSLFPMWPQNTIFSFSVLRLLFFFEMCFFGQQVFSFIKRLWALTRITVFLLCRLATANLILGAIKEDSCSLIHSVGFLEKKRTLNFWTRT